jgi:4-carboxymuconolactone decarboxylase
MDKSYETGLEIMTRVAVDYAGGLAQKLDGIAPGFAKTVIAFAFGSIASRPGLDLRTRELVTVAGLTALASTGPQLSVHIRGALNVGCAKEEIAEAIIQMAPYAGIPASLNALGQAQTIFEEQRD